MFDMYDRIIRIQQRIISYANIIAKLDPVRDASRIQRNNNRISSDMDELNEYQYGLDDSESNIISLISDLDNITRDYRSYQEKTIRQYRTSMHNMWLSIDDVKKHPSVNIPSLPLK